MYPFNIPPIRPRQDCPDCKGEGKILLFNLFSPCDTCDGTGLVDVVEPEITVDVEEPIKLDPDDFTITGLD